MQVDAEWRAESAALSQEGSADSPHTTVDALQPPRPTPDADTAAAVTAATTELSQSTPQDADEEAVAPASDLHLWQYAGHEWIGAHIARKFGKRVTIGVVQRWLPPNEEEGEAALFHVFHDDGDEEDLEEYEMEAALEMLKTDPQAIKRAEKFTARKAKAAAAAEERKAKMAEKVAKAEKKKAEDAEKQRAKEAERAAKEAAKAAERAEKEKAKAAERAAKEEARAQRAAEMEEARMAKEAARQLREEEKAQRPPKLPKAPRRARTPYECFAQASRGPVSAAHKELDAPEITKLVNEMWKTAGAEERQRYEAEAAEDKTRYDEERKRFEEECKEAGLDPAEVTLKGRRVSGGADTNGQQTHKVAYPLGQQENADDQVAAGASDAPLKQKPQSARLQATARLQAALRTAAAVEAARAAEASSGSKGKGSLPQPVGQIPLAAWIRGSGTEQSDAADGGTAAAEELLVLWSFFHRFRQELGVSPFSPHELCATVLCPSQPVLLAELFLAMLRIVIDDGRQLRQSAKPPPLGGDVAPSALQQLPRTASVLSRTNWPEVLRCVCWMLPEMHEPAMCASALREMQEDGIEGTSPQHRLALLRSLADVCLDTDVLQRSLRDRSEKLGEVQKDLREAQLNLQRQSKEELAAQLAEATASSVSDAPTSVRVTFLSVAAPLVRRKAGGSEESGVGDGAEGESIPEGSEDTDAEEVAALKAAREEATAALLAAIEKRNATKLDAAIKQASNNGHCGQLSDGRSWCTEELRAARGLLATEKQRQVRLSHQQSLEAALLKLQRTHQQRAAECAIREEALGEDAQGRRYWALGGELPRLWVELREGDGCRWACYDSAAAVEHLATALRGDAPPESALRANVQQLLPMLASGIAPASASSTKPDGGDEDPTEEEMAAMKVDQLKDLLRAQGLKVVGRRDELISRLVRAKQRRTRQATPAQAETGGSSGPDDEDAGEEAEADEEEWLFEGHSLLGSRVARPFGKRAALGTINKWLPANEAEGDPALFHVMHDDGDEEDLEEFEVEEAIELYKTHPTALRYERVKAENAAVELAAAAAAAKAEARTNVTGWRDRGHELIGQLALLEPPDENGSAQSDAPDAAAASKSDGQPQTDGHRVGRIAAWLPADGNVRKLDFFRIALLDGLSDDVTQEAASAAASAYLQLEDAQEVAQKEMERLTYENKSSRKGQRVTQEHFSLDAVQAELLEFESDINEALIRAQKAAPSQLDVHSHQRFVRACDSADDVQQLSTCLLELEKEVYALQRVPDASERKPWRFEGDPFIGKPVRRFFAEQGSYVYGNGIITAWLPPEADEPALWHMRHDDGDEEDLEEYEVLWAMESFAEGRSEPTEDEAQAANQALAARIAADYAAARAAEEKSDSDGDEERQEAAAEREEERLWLSEEGRARWQVGVQSTKTAESLALSLTALKVHCLRFAPLLGKARGSKLQREGAQLIATSWYHEDAFAHKRARTH